MLNKIEQLILAIHTKHNTHCTFTVNEVSGEIRYKIYIADDFISEYRHMNHNTIDAAIERFEQYLSIEDVTIANIDACRDKIEGLCFKRTTIDEDIHYLEERIKYLQGDLT